MHPFGKQYAYREKATGQFVSRQTYYAKASATSGLRDHLKFLRRIPSKGYPSREEVIAYSKEHYELVEFTLSEFSNTPTVVVILATDDQGQLIAVRRNNTPGKGLLGLPGGYQMAGETWQEAGVREFLEETGLWVDPESLKQFSPTVTDEYGNNLLIAVSRLPATRGNATPDPKEVQEVVRLVDLPAKHEVAFPRHFAAMSQLFHERSTNAMFADMYA